MVTIRLRADEYDQLCSGQAIEVITASDNPSEKYQTVTIEPP